MKTPQLSTATGQLMARDAVLNARCAVALGRVIEPIDADAALMQYHHGWVCAFRAAWHAEGVDVVPMMFEGFETLLDGWIEGKRMFALEIDPVRAAISKSLSVRLAVELRGQA